jgi:hypothetical protein
MSVTSSNLSSVGATISWKTNRPANSQVEYGFTTSYGNSMSIKTMETNHSLTLIGLSPETLYHYKVKSQDEAGNLSTSSDQTFTTTKSGSAPIPPPGPIPGPTPKPVPTPTPVPAPTPDPKDLNELAPYTGPFGEEQARILFDRFGFGAPQERIDEAVKDGLELTIKKLTTWKPENGSDPSFPYDLDSIVFEWACHNGLKGEPQDTPKACNRSDPYDFAHKTYADSKMIYFLHTPNPYFYKLILFLHDERLAGSDIDGDKYFYRHMYVDHWNMLVTAAKSGDYIQFMRSWMKDSMGHVFWQNGGDNLKSHPNENFAREFWELGTLGTTDLDGKPVYTDMDIAQAALVHTGYSRETANDVHGDYKYGVYRQEDHAAGTFDIFVNTPYYARVSTQEELLQATFRHPRAAEYMAEDLWKEFINPYKTPDAIRELAKIIRAYQFNLTPVMQVIMRSKTLYAPGSKESLIKQPTELVIGFLRSFPGYNPSHIKSGAEYFVLLNHIDDLGQRFFSPPTIFGWNEKVLAGAGYIKTWRDVANNLLTVTTYARADFFAKYSLREHFSNGLTSTGALIDRLSRAFNVPLNATQRAFLDNFLNTEPALCDSTTQTEPACKEGGKVFARESKFYGKATAGQQEERIKGAISILVNQPSYRTK